jgi:hypothetical protein
MAYCSPKQEEHYKEFKSCFDKKTLLRMTYSWNRFHPTDLIEHPEKLTHRKLWMMLNDRFKPMCGDKKEICWVEQLHLNNDEHVKDSVRPEMPKEWLEKPHTWLTNFNIEAVMEQYEKVNPNFKFLGVFPVDFSSKDYFSNNKCLYEETCNLDMEYQLEKGIRYIGMVINLDKHDEPGSHWVSLFICIDPKQSCFGAYYYDSYSGEPPAEVEQFMYDLQKQGNAYARSHGIKRSFKVQHNTVRHQYGHSECGMFSMVYLIRWMTLLKQRKHVTMEDVVNVKITDDDVYKMRSIFFRPYYQFKKTMAK